MEKGSGLAHLCIYFSSGICILKHVFENPKEAAEYLKSHNFFKQFISRWSTDAYIDGLCDSLQSICIGSPVKQSTAKRRLSAILLAEEQSSSEDEGRANIKRSRVAWESETENDALPGTSAMTVDEILNKASSKKKKRQKKAKKY